MTRKSATESLTFFIFLRKHFMCTPSFGTRCLTCWSDSKTITILIFTLHYMIIHLTLFAYSSYPISKHMIFRSSRGVGFWVTERKMIYPAYSLFHLLSPVLVDKQICAITYTTGPTATSFVWGEHSF